MFLPLEKLIVCVCAKLHTVWMKRGSTAILFEEKKNYYKFKRPPVLNLIFFNLENSDQIYGCISHLKSLFTVGNLKGRNFINQYRFCLKFWLRWKRELFVAFVNLVCPKDFIKKNSPQNTCDKFILIYSF